MSNQLKFKKIIIIVALLFGLASLVSSKAAAVKVNDKTASMVRSKATWPASTNCESVVSAACGSSSSLGALHNAILLALTPDSSPKDTYKQMVGYLSSIGVEVEVELDPLLTIIEQIKAGTVLQDLEQNHFICSSGIKYITELNNLLSQSLSSDETERQINELSRTMQGDPNILDTEKVLLCHACGVGIYSYRFWNASATDVNHPWHANSIAAAKPQQPLPKFSIWKAVGDVAGFIGGAYITKTFTGACAGGSFVSGMF